jgi:hypothetical protein
MWVVTSLLSSVYDYAGACNAINPVMHEGPRVQIAIAPSLPIGEGYQSIVWIIHIRDIPKLWDDTKNLLKLKKSVKFGPLIGHIYSRIVVGRWYLVVRRLLGNAVWRAPLG